jgi:tetratricopeptide (TPR) repeat protein
VTAFHRAGERALGVNAYDAAGRFFAAELELRPGDDPARPYALLGLGKARGHAEGGGVAELEQAFAALDAAGDDETAAEVASSIGPLLWARGEAEGASSWLHRSAEIAAGLPPTRTKAMVLSRLASLHSVRDEPDQAIRVATDALALAGELDSDEVRARALGALANARTQLGDWDGFDDYARSIELATKLRSPEAIVNIINYAGSRIAYGDLAGAFELQAQGRGLARELGEGRYAAWLHAEQVSECYWTGRWDDALVLAREVVEAGGGTAYMEIPARLTRARVLADRGRPDEALAEVERALAQALEIGDVQVVVPALALRARLRAEADPAGAETDIGEALARVPGKEIWTSYAWADLSVALAALGLPFPELPVSSRWIEASRAVADDPADAADRYAEIGTRPDEAFARLRAGQLGRAREFYREVGAEAALSSA